MKIFKIGSCRTNIENNDNDKHTFYKNFFTHSTKEVIQFLNVIYGLDDYCLYPYRNMIHNSDDINIELIKYNFHNSDIILIEISTLKEVFINKNNKNMYYQLDNYGRYVTNNIKNEFKMNIISENDFLKDINIICNLIKNKKIIFVGHLNFNFEFGRIQAREFIDEYLIKSNKNYILWEKIESDYKKVCTTLENKKTVDVNHLSNNGKELFKNFLLKYINEIISN